MTRFKSLLQPPSQLQSSQAFTGQDASIGGQLLQWPASYGAYGLSELSPDDWSLSTSGNIEKPTRFVYRNIQALPQTTQERRWISADGWTIKAFWQGVLLEELVKRIHPQALNNTSTIEQVDLLNQNTSAIWIHQKNAQGDTESLLLKDLIEGQAILCHKVNAQSLPWLYGGPVALMVFDRYGYKGLGQITELSFESQPLETSNHQKKGYPSDGHIAPGDYYAFDLQAFRPLHGPERYEPSEIGYKS